MNFYIYDLETYRTLFLFLGKFRGSPDIHTFEISRRRNDRDALLQHLNYLKNSNVVMVGYNNLGFDEPILAELINSPYNFTELTAYNKAQNIFATQHFVRPYTRMQDRYLPQLDLMKLHHFDNKNKATTLKDLQFAMRMESVEDLPYDPASDLTDAQMDHVRSYGAHDLEATEKFLDLSEPAIKIRQELIQQNILFGDVLNWSDVKLGEQFLVKKIGRAKCYLKGSTPRQTYRESVRFQDIILKKIAFRTEAFQKVLEWFNSQTVWTKKKDERPELEVNLAGLDFKFGLGGVHASVEKKYFESNADYVIRDIDVAGMYVAVGVVAGFHPEHLGQEFVAAYRQLQSDRKLYPKEAAMNKVLKLAGNGVYGNSNNEYSPFFDTKYTYSVTVNGQLQLLMLAEVLSLIPGIQLIQANTDGITAYVPRAVNHFFDLWKSDWECITGLKLEDAEYKKMWIRDVNNYVAIDTKGKTKLKGAYWYPKVAEDYWGGSGSNWNKDFSNMAVQKAVEQMFLSGCSAEAAIRLVTNPFDFMLRQKTRGGAKLFIGDKQMSKTTRYYVSTRGEKMYKRSLPTGEIGQYKRKNGLKDAEFERINATVPKGEWDARIHNQKKSKYAETITSIESGYLVKCCNNAKDFDWNDLDYSYYLNEVKKLEIL